MLGESGSILAAMAANTSHSACASAQPQPMTVLRKNSRVTSVQVLRGVAAALVVMHHFSQSVEMYSRQKSLIVSSGLGALGSVGVDLFFVISGFIMIYTTRDRRGVHDALTFFGKRARRVYPLYWMWTTVLLSLVVGRIALRGHTYPAEYIVASYLLVPMFNESNGNSLPLLWQGWTLSFEMLFYVAFAAAMTIVGSKSRSFVVALILGATALLATLILSPSAVRDLMANSLSVEFVLGMLAAEFVIRLQMREKSVPIVVAVGLVALGTMLLLGTLWVPPGVIPRGLVWGLPSFFILLGTALPRNSSSRPGAFDFLGDASYSIYLTHGFFSLALGMALRRFWFMHSIRADALIVVATMSTTFLGSLTYLAIEKPLLRWVSPRTLARDDIDLVLDPTAGNITPGIGLDRRDDRDRDPHTRS
ncbi:MAG TPA: acyltransferase [Polyangiales bacterium]|nr:acyltransferase [Polyangiales bacterium]